MILWKEYLCGFRRKSGVSMRGTKGAYGAIDPHVLIVCSVVIPDPLSSTCRIGGQQASRWGTQTPHHELEWGCHLIRVAVSSSAAARCGCCSQKDEAFHACGQRVRPWGLMVERVESQLAPTRKHVVFSRFPMM